MELSLDGMLSSLCSRVCVCVCGEDRSRRKEATEENEEGKKKKKDKPAFQDTATRYKFTDEMFQYAYKLLTCLSESAEKKL